MDRVRAEAASSRPVRTPSRVMVLNRPAKSRGANMATGTCAASSLVKAGIPLATPPCTTRSGFRARIISTLGCRWVPTVGIPLTVSSP